MFRIIRRVVAKQLESKYRKLLQHARDLQRNGDIEGFAAMTARAEEIGQRIEAIRKSQR